MTYIVSLMGSPACLPWSPTARRFFRGTCWLAVFYSRARSHCLLGRLSPASSMRDSVSRLSLSTRRRSSARCAAAAASRSHAVRPTRDQMVADALFRRC